MKFSSTAIITLVSGALATGDGGCNANNCARAVTGTRKGPEQVLVAKSDCSSYQKTVTVPRPVTVTTTKGICRTCGRGHHRRDEDHLAVFEEAPIVARAEFITASAIPTYASACDKPGEYASACSCWGIRPVTYIAPRPTATVTKTRACCKNKFGQCNRWCMGDH